jgi:hypothetical protein
MQLCSCISFSAICSYLFYFLLCMLTVRYLRQFTFNHDIFDSLSSTILSSTVYLQPCYLRQLIFIRAIFNSLSSTVLPKSHSLYFSVMFRNDYSVDWLETVSVSQSTYLMTCNRNEPFNISVKAKTILPEVS